MSNVHAFAVRDLHVGATTREAIRHIRGKLNARALTREKRAARHAIIRGALDAHAQNGSLFSFVVRGSNPVRIA